MDTKRIGDTEDITQLKKREPESGTNPHSDKASQKSKTSPHDIEHHSQSWTELTTVFHLLSDCTKEYIQEQLQRGGTPLSRGEKDFLSKLIKSVSCRIEKQNQITLENRQLKRQCKSVTTAVKGRRKKLLTTKLQIQEVERECAQLEMDVQVMEEKARSMERANRLVRTLTALRENGYEKGD
mmetsp:Transcript_35303/g.51884  ORF Transcript_35303/g.51884 Transcript_35303/m.51884 type:complete len:182 (-) Transcript_35303:185-730(-)|eukprot:CAMPEP_0195530384 /NCGR_PEP_ID=MMETSP0794_2-20130614/33242_1 /TAXON_ID=515487 /ORGANISM="Stephanopyxis turris, Strain CCMP 815" /LENGTH=181 /DNA_ID=CAMNT_0040661875 /DNA_START=136 /DNA_END=681 /DNA_ORIENTATION=-